MAKWVKIITAGSYPGIVDLDKADAFFLTGDDRTGKCIDIWLNNNVVRVLEQSNPQTFSMIIAFMKAKGF